jgi:hypothetical protein
VLPSIEGKRNVECKDDDINARNVDALKVKARLAGFCIVSDIWMCLFLPAAQTIVACYLKDLCLLLRAILAIW